MSAPAAASLHSVEDLVAAGLVAESERAVLAKVAETFAIAVSPTVAALIDRSDPNDPIGRQFLPDKAELFVLPEERADPIGDKAKSPLEGLVHRYPDRVLLKLVNICPVYCRFCFRREMIGPGHVPHLAPADVAAALAYIADHPEIFEVILTGGDPLMLSPRRLGEITTALDRIAHVKILRIHTRVPIAEPSLISDALVAALRQTNKTVYVALHANHPRELTEAALLACGKLIDAGIPMLSQSVLLRGVNDDVGTLAALMRAFVAARIKPYYLHHPDLARGTSHFRVSIEAGQALMRRLRGHISGLCQPHYVLDIPGGFGKAPLSPHFISQKDDLLPADGVVFDVEDFCGEVHAYPPSR